MAGQWLRDDLRVMYLYLYVGTKTVSRQNRNAIRHLKTPVYLMYVIHEFPGKDIMIEAERDLDPVYEIRVDNYPVLRIYRIHDP